MLHKIFTHSTLLCLIAIIRGVSFELHKVPHEGCLYSFASLEQYAHSIVASFMLPSSKYSVSLIRKLTNI